MTNTKSTKHALLASVMALFLCFTMLLGTTFAWFTDSAASGSNVITAGNLDLEVEYTLDGTNWDKLDGATDLFQKDLWEPGHTEVVALRITNNGSLALKYTANMNVNDETPGKNKDGGDIVLSEILTVGTLVQAANQVGDIAVELAFTNENMYKGTTAFKASNVLEENQELFPGDAHYVIIKVDMAETVGNEANAVDKDNVPSIDFGINVVATQFTYEKDSFGTDYDKDAIYPVANIQEFQAAIGEAEDGDIITFTNDLAGDVTVPQKADTKIIIDGNNQKFTGTILVDGKSATQTTAGITIKNINFTDATADACITLGKSGDNNTRYTCNVTIENCTFDAPGKVGVKSYTSGDKNLTITGCTATANAHSLVQVAGVDKVVVENCEVYSKNGANFNQSTNVTIIGSTFDVKGYAVRFGAGSGDSALVETYLIKDCSLKSANDDGDATIILRGTADYSTLTIENTTIVGTPDITNTATGATVVK